MREKWGKRKLRGDDKDSDGEESSGQGAQRRKWEGGRRRRS